MSFKSPARYHHEYSKIFQISPHITMASIVGFLSRNWQLLSPPSTPKNPEPLRFGIISAANIV